ncbi:MAG: DNA replication/repair protein RecF [Acutalibacteraceae bacterium]|nr:DNA replication/repair protein RecF [Acutalibacteraceae bacterium]
MIVKNLTSKGFRNFDELDFSPSQNMNVIYGDNAQGKTNLLEAIWLFCGAKSFRGAKDNELLGFGKKKAVNTCDFIFGENEKNAKIIIEEKRKAELNGNMLSSASKLAGNFYAIAFSPIDLNLVNDGPNVRRRFLDTAIGQIYPLYNEKLRNYMKAIKQRNTILRDVKYHSDIEFLLDDFEKSLSVLIKEIVKYRYRYVEILKEIAPEIYGGISGDKEKLSTEYSSPVLKDMGIEDILKLLKNSRKEDILTGNTSIGPHRDDLELVLNNSKLKSYGSQGQRRSVCLTLKLSEAKVLKKITGEYPIALLDDVMSELDKSRQDFILNHIKDWQVFITCCDPSNIKGLKDGTVFQMEGGKFCNITVK